MERRSLSMRGEVEDKEDNGYQLLVNKGLGIDREKPAEAFAVERVESGSYSDSDTLQ